MNNRTIVIAAVIILIAVVAYAAYQSLHSSNSSCRQGDPACGTMQPTR
jgi:hypothetical protein